ncbi:hypothetical protein Agub_g11608, partial [Astrephomene gubernaculifera]
GGAGGGVGGGRGFRKRQQSCVYELALLSRGDVVNGMILHGRASCFTVVAATTLKVMSLEVTGGIASLEQLLGREQAASLRDLVLRQAEMHRERAAHMVAVRQTSAALMGDRGLPPAPLPDTHLAASFMAHYVPVTPGAEGGSGLPLMGYAAAVADSSLFVPGALQHGDVMKLVCGVGQAVVDCALPSAQRAAVAAGAGGGGGGTMASSSVSGGGGSGAPQPSTSSSLLQQPHPHPQPQQQGPRGGGGGGDPTHVTTVVAQPVPIPRTRMRAPCVGMARELGLVAPPPAQMPPSLASELSSLAVFPDPAGGKSRNGRPRAPHRTKLGLPFAGNVAMLVLENHSNLVKVVSPAPCGLDAVNALRKANSASSLNVHGRGGVPPGMRVSGGGEGSCVEVYGDDGRYGSEGPSLTVVLPDVRMSVAAAGVVSAAVAAMSSDVDARCDYTSSCDEDDSDDDAGVGGAGGVIGGASVGGSPDWSEGCTTAAAASAAQAGVSLSSSAPAGGPAMTSAAAAAAPTSSSREISLVQAVGSLEAVDPNNSSSGGSSGMQLTGGVVAAGLVLPSGSGSSGSPHESGSVPDLPWRSVRPSAQSSSALASSSHPSLVYGQGSFSTGGAAGGSSLSHVEPLTLAASKSTSQLHPANHPNHHTYSPAPAVQSSLASLGPSPSFPSYSGPQRAASMSSAAMAGPPGTPLVAGQAHVPPSLPYLRAAPAPGTPGTAGALPSPALIKTAVVQLASSEATAKLTANRLTTIMSAGPLAAGSGATTASANKTTTAAAAAAAAASITATAAATITSSGGAADPSRAASAPATDPSSSAATATTLTTQLTVNRSQSQPRAQPSDPNTTPAAATTATSDPTTLSKHLHENVIILPRMVFYEGAAFESGGVNSPRGGLRQAAGLTAVTSFSGSAPSSPRGSFRGAAAAGKGAASPRGSNGFPLPPMPGRSPSSPNAAASLPVGSPHTTYALPAIPGSSSAGAAAGAAAGGSSSSPSSFSPPRQAQDGNAPYDQQQQQPQRSSPGRVRVMDAPAAAYQFGVPRDLLGYYSTANKAFVPTGDGPVFTGGLGGRGARYAAGGGNRQRGGDGGGGGQRRYGGVSLRDLAGVNGLPGRNRRRGGGAGGGGAGKPLVDGPELPLEMDTEAPPLANHKLSEPSLDDLKYILSRWSTTWSQERTELRILSRLGRRDNDKTALSYPGSNTASALASSLHASDQAAHRMATAAAAAAAGYGVGGNISSSGNPGQPVRLPTPVELSQFGYSLDDMGAVFGVGARQKGDEMVGMGGYRRSLAGQMQAGAGGKYGPRRTGTSTGTGTGTGTGASDGGGVAVRG